MKQEMRIAVVGGGLGGLTAAILLQQAGFEVAVYEQANSLQRIGAGIHLHANLMRVMVAANVHQRMYSIGLTPKNWLSREWDTGKVLFEPSIDEWRGRYGLDHLIMHRGDMQSVLADAVLPGTLHFGKRLLDIDERLNGVRLTFADGTDAFADPSSGGIPTCVRHQQVVVGRSSPGARGSALHNLLPHARTR